MKTKLILERALETIYSKIVGFKKGSDTIKILRKLLIIFLSIIIIPVNITAETTREALGEQNYLLAVNTEHGDAYINSFQRTFNPSINKWGTKTGVMPNGDSIISLDSWTIADVLGSNYSILAYTPERGNCYVNANNETYTPGSNQYGRYVGRTANGLPIINVVGTIYPVTYTTITRTVSYPGSNATPAQAGQERRQAPEEDFMVWIYPANGERYHSRQGCKPGSDKQVPYSSIIGTRFDVPCSDCW